MTSNSSWAVFARNKLEPKGFETDRMAYAFAWKVVGAFKAAGVGNHPVALAMAKCTAGQASCGMVSCSICDRRRRTLFAREVRRKFYPLEKAGTYEVFFVTIIPDDGLMRLGKLPQTDWTKRRRRYQRKLVQALGPNVVAMFGPDIDIRRRGQCCLHLHAIVAVPVGSISFRRFTEKLVAVFNPQRIGAKRPVLKKRVAGKYWKMATYVMKARFAVASKVHKHNGVFLGKREVPIRTFMSGIHPRARIIRIN